MKCNSKRHTKNRAVVGLLHGKKCEEILQGLQGSSNRLITDWQSQWDANNRLIFQLYCSDICAWELGSHFIWSHWGSHFIIFENRPFYYAESRLGFRGVSLSGTEIEKSFTASNPNPMVEIIVKDVSFFAFADKIAKYLPIIGNRFFNFCEWRWSF